MDRRQVLAVAAGTGLAAGLFGCSGRDEAGSGEGVTLSISTWTYTEQIGQWWDVMIKKFEQEHPSITIDLRQIAYADYVSTVTTQAVAGSAPAIIHVPTPTSTLPAWADAEFLVPLDDFLSTTDVHDMWPTAQKTMEWQGTSYGALLVDYGYTLYYNEALLSQAGVGVPTTARELVAAAESVSGLPGDKYGFAITDDNTENFVRDALVFVAGAQASWIKDGVWRFGSPEVVAALDIWRELGTRYSPLGTNFAAKREAFLNGNSAMMIEGPFYYATVRDTAAPELVDSLRIARAPFAANPGDASHGLSINSELDDAVRAAAMKFLGFVISTKALTEYSKLVTSPTARASSADSLLDDPLTAPIVKAHKDSVPIVDPGAEGVRANYAEFSEIVAVQLHRLLQSDAPTADTLAELDTQLAGAELKP